MNNTCLDVMRSRQHKSKGTMDFIHYFLYFLQCQSYLQCLLRYTRSFRNIYIFYTNKFVDTQKIQRYNCTHFKWISKRFPLNVEIIDARFPEFPKQWWQFCTMVQLLCCGWTLELMYSGPYQCSCCHWPVSHLTEMALPPPGWLVQRPEDLRDTEGGGGVMINKMKRKKAQSIKLALPQCCSWSLNS